MSHPTLEQLTEISKQFDAVDLTISQSIKLREYEIHGNDKIKEAVKKIFDGFDDLQIALREEGRKQIGH